MLRHRIREWLRPRYLKRYLGSYSKVHRSTRLQFEERLTLGRYAYVGPRTLINSEGGVSIGDGTIIAPEVVILSSSHDYRAEQLLPYDVFDVHRKVSIGRGVWIGFGAMLCPGVSIGDGAVIAMGSVVSRDVQDGEVVAGNPARVIKSRDVSKIADNIEKENYFHKRYWAERRSRRKSE